MEMSGQLHAVVVLLQAKETSGTNWTKRLDKRGRGGNLKQTK
jgi:hypothetical protein